MRVFTRIGLLSFICALAWGCSHHSDTAGAAAAPAAAPAGEKVHGPRQSYTGEVVRRNGEYCFKPLDQGEAIQRLTRAADPQEFVSDEIKLRKYYGKII